MNGQSELDIRVFCKMNTSTVNCVDNWIDVCERHVQRKTGQLETNNVYWAHPMNDNSGGGGGSKSAGFRFSEI